MVYLDCFHSTQYVGNRSVTKSGRTCQMWSSQYPHRHIAGTQDSQFPDGSVTAAHNYCRDPGSRGYLWCYTTDPKIDLEICDFNICDNNETGQ